MDPLIKAGVALITGAGSGMGQSTAIQFAVSGCTKLFLVDINEKGLRETEELARKATGSAELKVVLHTTNVSVEEEVITMVKTCVEQFGRLDFAINNAGIALGSVKTADITAAQFDKLYAVNEKGVFLCMKHEIDQMLKQSPLENIFSPTVQTSEVIHERGSRGSIVNTASLSGKAGLATLSAYTTTKHAVIVMTRVNARQYAPDKIRINSVCPGFVPTPLMASAGLSDEFLEAIKVQSPMNRVTHPIEIADSIVFLSTSGASGITGVDLAVDAGAGLFHVI